nr:EOG090X0CJ3 [Eulimnadia texana]
MANKTDDVSLFLDFEIKGATASGLDFQDFSEAKFVSDGFEKTHNFSNFPESHADDDEETAVVRPRAEESEGSNPSVWTFSYYQRLFDVDTSEVKERLVWSVVPRPSKDFLNHVIKSKPDLYGPFWVCVTLIFCIAIMGNIADYIQSAGEGTRWRYDFQKVSLSATTIFCYATLLPLGLWVFVWWRRKLGEQLELGFVEIACLYGYSLAVYIPVSVFWTIPLAWLQWFLVLVAAALSGSVLLLALWKPLSASKKSIAAILLILILLSHLLLAAGLQLYFFRYSGSKNVQNNALESKITEPVKLENNSVVADETGKVQTVEKDSKTKREENHAVTNHEKSGGKDRPANFTNKN